MKYFTKTANKIKEFREKALKRKIYGNETKKQLERRWGVDMGTSNDFNSTKVPMVFEKENPNFDYRGVTIVGENGFGDYLLYDKKDDLFKEYVHDSGKFINEIK